MNVHVRHGVAPGVSSVFVAYLSDGVIGKSLS